MNQIIKIWSILLLLPVIPVVLIYLFFADRNFFELQHAAKGIVATGPIAAYVGLILIGSNIYRRMARVPDSGSEHLVGTWTIASTSSNGTQGGGNCYIQNDRGELTIGGDFTSQDNKEAGSWHCEMAKMKNHRLMMAYSLTTIRDTKNETLDGITILSFGNPPVTSMTGIWVVTGREDMSGTVVYSRVK